MLRDLEAGAKVEARHLQGDMIERGLALGVEVGLVRTAYAHLQAYQARNGLG
jgi:2-dehydropantoate 2-reductase